MSFADQRTTETRSKSDSRSNRSATLSGLTCISVAREREVSPSLFVPSNILGVLAAGRVLTGLEQMSLLRPSLNGLYRGHALLHLGAL
jgi:hypothetical protein